MKKVLIVSSFLLVLTTLFLSFGCTPQPTATPTQTTPAQPIELTYSSYIGPASPLEQVVTGWYLPEVTKRTQGRVTFKIFQSEALGKRVDQYDLLQRGVADIICQVTTSLPTGGARIGVVSLPFLVEDPLAFVPVLKDLIDGGQMPEFDNVKVLAEAATTPYEFEFVSKQPMSLADFNGMKIIIPTGTLKPTIEALGAVPLEIGTVDAYLALQRGTADGNTAFPYQMEQYKWYEVCKYWLRVQLGAAAFGYIMNKDTYDKLPPDIQKVFDDLYMDLSNNLLQKAFLDANQKAIPVLQQSGMVSYTLSDAELSKLHKAGAPVATKWATDMDGKGYNGTQFLATLKDVMQKNGQNWPY